LLKGRFLSRDWKSEGVMDDESGDDEKDGLTSEWGGELRQDWRDWENESGSWFQGRADNVMHTWMSDLWFFILDYFEDY